MRHHLKTSSCIHLGHISGSIYAAVKMTAAGDTRILECEQSILSAQKCETLASCTQRKTFSSASSRSKALPQVGRDCFFTGGKWANKPKATFKEHVHILLQCWKCPLHLNWLLSGYYSKIRTKTMWLLISASSELLVFIMNALYSAVWKTLALLTFLAARGWPRAFWSLFTRSHVSGMLIENLGGFGCWLLAPYWVASKMSHIQQFCGLGWRVPVCEISWPNGPV